MSGASEPSWTRAPPAAYDIVACWYPETGGTAGASNAKLRPCLITSVLSDPDEPNLFFCRVAYGTNTLKIVQRQRLDLIVQVPADVREVGLAKATRFDLNNVAILPWTNEFFGCWSGYFTPRIGALSEHYIRDYAFLMMRRNSA